ncbi:MAG: ATP-binding protein [Deltaproteobacteria bacterium]|nr:ATP-binding protein [Deltaproteobacteria bacterium]
MFLFGPRGTGKSTWIGQRFPEARTYDLLDLETFARLQRNPSTLFHDTSTLPEGSWVVIDEVQKIPPLLDEVHRLIENKKLKFVLSGSSARKLRRGGVNLLAGRALVEHMYPLTSAEVDFGLDLPGVLSTGMLPRAYTGPDTAQFLTSYAVTYLQEEIRAEALTRNIGHFSRFLEIAARQNGQVTSISSISRDAQVSRATAQGYFDILVDTLIGFWLHPWKLKTSNREIGHPKFFFFDTGVARALSGRIPYPPTAEELGPLLETFILGELRAFVSYRRLHYPLYFWRTQDGVEVDVLFETRDGFLAVEIKSGTRWDPRFNRGLKRLSELMSPKKVTCLGVYLWNTETVVDGVRVLPVLQFLKELWGGELVK